MAYQILVVDDEKLIVKGIKFSLEQDGMEVTTAYDGEEALQNIKEKNFDLVVLDVMLPKMDGLQVCQQTREFSQVPIIMVTAKGEDMDKIMGLEYGADDYITKPFNILELKARIKAILRRSVKKTTAAPEAKHSLKARDLELAFDSRRVFVSGREVNLTAKEFDLLELLMENPGQVFTRDRILSVIWESDYVGETRTVDVHIATLRTKLRQCGDYIETVRGVGYRFGKNDEKGSRA